MSAVNHVGLDIGSTSIRAVEASRSKDRTVINNFGQALLPEGAVSGGVVHDDRAVIGALRQLWTNYGFKSKDVALGVAHQQVVVREVTVSNLPPKELRLSLPFQVREVLPLPVEDALLDFYPLEDPGKNATVRGLLIAAPRESVISTARAVEKAGLRVAKVDLACFAALRAAARLDEGSEAVVDLGASATNIIIHTDGIPQIVRSIPRGATEITSTVATRLGLTTVEAEFLKCRVGLIDEEFPENSEAVNEGLRPLVNEIRSSLAYYENNQAGGQVTRLALVGGGALLPGLAQQLTDSLGVPAYLPDPLQRASDSRRGGRHDILGRFSSSAAVSIGLTLGAA